jgi:hypothetical protein
MQSPFATALAVPLAWAFLTDAAAACRVTPPVSALEELKQVPPHGYAFSGTVLELRWAGGKAPRAIPHGGFSLKIRVAHSYAKPVSRTVVVQYGPCDFAPAPGEKINVIAENGEGGLQAVYYAEHFGLAPR